MKLQLRQQTVQALNQQYKTHSFAANMTLNELVQCAQKAMRSKIEIIDYELNGWIIYKYGIKVKSCEQHPFTETERQHIGELTQLATTLIKSFYSESGAGVNNSLEGLKQLILKYGTKLQISQRYHKYQLYFKTISLKQAIIFQTLNKCQIFYTIIRQRKKSGKEFYLDPLIQCFERIKNKLGILHPFHEKVLPKKQLRFFQKKVTDKKMKNVLFQAVSSRRHKQVKELIAKGASLEEAGINERQHNRQMYCSHRACQLGDLQMCKILHSYKVNWQVKQKQGMAPLHYAAQSGSLALVKFLVQEAGAQLQPKDIQERTPFYFACTEGDLDVIRYLYSRGTDINNKSKLGRSALSKACYLGLVNIVMFLMECPGIILETQDGKGRTALHNAVFGPKGGRQGHKFGTNQKDSPECTQLLLENGFNVDYLDKENNTPLHVAMSSDGKDSIRVLLAFGGSLTKLNCYGQTPLMTGAKFGHLESVRMLREEYGSSLTIKDIFNKNLMLLCAKFRQDEGKCINSVFYYSTDQLLGMARQNQPLSQQKSQINNWEQEIDYTFSQLLKQRSRVDEQFKYFCLKCRELGLTVTNLTLEHIKSLLDIIKTSQDKDHFQIYQYFICRRPKSSKLKLTKQQYCQFAKWVILQNSVKLLQSLGKIQKSLMQYFIIENQIQTISFFSYIQTVLFDIIPQIKQKSLTFCLLKLNINWLDYIHPQYYYNILHLLVKHKKVGSLIQILKVLSGVKMDFITNQFVIALLKDQEIFISKQTKQIQSPLSIVLTNMLIHKDAQGFDPYHLALLIKDASSTKLLQQKLSKQAAIGKPQFQVKEYSVAVQSDPHQIQLFNKGYQIQEQLQQFCQIIQNSQTKNQLSQYFSLLKMKQSDIHNSINIDNFALAWKDLSKRKITQIYEVSQVPSLQVLQLQSIIGIDIEYFYTDGATLISIMQISSLHQDFIIDFLCSAKSHTLNQQFTSAVRTVLRKVAYNPRITKLMHGSDNDLCVIKSVLKFSFLNFLDTARLDIELRKHQNIRGLATLVKQYLGEHMSKDYQVSEWRIRPIPSSMIDYARRDSLVLPFLARAILNLLPEQRLKEMLLGGCRQARRNRKGSQPLVKSIQALTI